MAVSAVLAGASAPPPVRRGSRRGHRRAAGLRVAGLGSFRSAIGDGAPRFVVEGVHDGTVRAPSPTPAKGICVSHARPSLPVITDKDEADLEVAVEREVDFVA